MRLSLFAAAALLTATLAAHADTIRQFTIEATATSGVEVTGNLRYDVSTNKFSSGRVNIYYDGTGNPAFLAGQFVVGSNYQLQFSGLGDDLFLDLPNANPGDYYGGVISTTSRGTIILNAQPPNPPKGVTFSVTSGTVTEVPPPPPAVTPEPSSILLLGTGILGMAATLRRRYVFRRDASE